MSYPEDIPARKVDDGGLVEHRAYDLPRSIYTRCSRDGDEVEGAEAEVGAIIAEDDRWVVNLVLAVARADRGWVASGLSLDQGSTRSQ